MKLSPSQKNNPLWLEIKTALEERLEVLRRANDNSMPESVRNVHIGRIAEVKAMIEWDREAPPVSPERNDLSA